MDIKRYAEDNEALKLIQDAINIFSDGEKFHDNMSRRLHMLGLQGFKRWHRIQASGDRNHAIEVQHFVIDQFSENLEVTSEYVPTTPIDLKNGLELYLEWEISVYKRISKIANELVLLNFPCEAELIQKDLKGVTKEIEKARRNLQDFTNASWDWAYIRLVDNRLHEKCKEIEK